MSDMSEVEIDRLITVFATRLYGQAFKLLEEDPHQFSSRGCATCRSVSGIIGRDFGCIAEAKRKR